MRVAALAAVAGLLLAGCQAPADEPPDPTSASPATGPSSAAPDPGTSAAPSPPASDRLHWSGVVDVRSSMVFLPWETLAIAPGTTVRFHQLPDGDLRATPWVRQADAYIKDHDDPTGREGYRSSHFSLTGRIHALGTAQEPIVFTSAEESPGLADWNQLLLLSGSRLENVTTQYSHNGINLQGDGIVLANVTARESLWSCIDVYGSGAVLRDVEAYHCWHSAIGFKGTGDNLLQRAWAHDAMVGVNCEGGAQPRLEDVTVEAAGYPPSCPAGAVTIVPRAVDSAGGYYKGELVYPAPVFG